MRREDGVYDELDLVVSESRVQWNVEAGPVQCFSSRQHLVTLVKPVQMERVEAALIAVDNATVCPLDDDFNTFSQWKLDVGKGCDEPINVISKGVVPDFNPGDYNGQVLPRVVGTLRPVNVAGGAFNVWIMFPRDSGDVVIP